MGHPYTWKNKTDIDRKIMQIRREIASPSDSKVPALVKQLPAYYIDYNTLGCLLSATVGEQNHLL